MENRIKNPLLNQTKKKGRVLEKDTQYYPLIHSQSFRFCFSKAFSIQIIMKINEIIWLKALEKIMQKQTILVWLRIRVAKTNTQTHTRTHVHYLHGGKTWRRRSTKNNSDHYDSFQLSFLFLFLLKRNN